MSKVRFQMFIESDQKDSLESYHKNFNIPVAEIIRRAIDKFLSEWKEKKAIPAKDEITEKLLSIAGTCEGGPKNLADEHDKYLYGITKK